MRGLAVIGLAIGACASAPERAPERTFDVVSPGLRPFAHRIEPGTHVLRFRATCTGSLGGGPAYRCTRGMFTAVLAFDGPARPPVELRLWHDGRVVHTHASPSRCAEAETSQPNPPHTCTMYSPWGWDRLDGRDASETRVFDLVVDNAGPAREATLSVWLGDPHE